MTNNTYTMPSDISCPYCKEFIGKPHEDRVARELEQHYWKHKLEKLRIRHEKV